MRTSSSQFDLMVTFMEEHGDISKPSSNARGRISSIKKWEELVLLLNSSGNGDTKTTEKWKKVWADLKNNTKKKAARLHKSASGTGGGPAMQTKLTDLEQRVLNLIGVQVATGLGVEEAGLSQRCEIQLQTTPTTQPHESIQSQQHDIEPVPHSPSDTRAISSPPHTFEVEVQRLHHWDEPGPSTSYVAPILSPSQERTVRSPVNFYNMVEAQQDGHELSPIRLSSQRNVIQPEPARFGRTTPHRARTRRSPRRMLRPAHTEIAAQNFLQAEEFWRKFKIEQHRDYIGLRREQNRIRAMEVQTQREWQAIGIRVLDILDKFVNRYCNL